MNSLNRHIEEFLDYYCNLKNSPEYAVLLKGSWGCGKTWFIKNYFKKLEKFKKKYLYVSLYGISSYAEIEDSFFQQLHPILSHKGMALAGKILKGALRATVKIDLDDDGKPDISNTSNIPDINLPDYLSDTNGNILVFDDLERCCIKKQDMLGYINHFVEHQGFKVIIIANEDDIEAKDDENDKKETQYKIVKEKLIGKTFEIVSCFDDSFTEFVNLIERESIKDLLNENFENIKECYCASNYNNLRYLKQSLWDFERFCSKIPDDKISNKEFGKHFVQLFLSLSFEIKSASIGKDEVKKINQGYFEDGFEINEYGDKKPIYLLMNKKYYFVNFYEFIFDHNIWCNFFFKGIVDGDKINEYIDMSVFFNNNIVYNWVKFWHFYDLEDDEFECLYNVIISEIESCKYKELGDVVHVFSTLIYLSDLGVIKESKNVILDKAKKYIDIMTDNKDILLSRFEINDQFESDRWGGLSFHGQELSEFIELKEYISCKTEMAIVDILPEKGNMLLSLMIDNTEEFFKIITNGNDENYIFIERPVLSFIEPEKFAKNLLKLNKKSQRLIAKSLLNRYGNFDSQINLVNEKDWLIALMAILNEEYNEKQGSVSAYTIKNIIEHSINKCIARFSN